MKKKKLPIKPQPHQKQCLSSLKEHRQSGAKKGLIVMASGLGKTITSAHDVKNFFGEHGENRILYLCHQKEILEQSRDSYKEVLGDNYSYGILHGEEKTIRKVGILFATFQTMKNYKENFKKNEFDYIVVDEAHHGPAKTFRSVIQYFKPKFLLGMTATPIRSDKVNLRFVFGKTVFELRYPEAIVRGLLARVKVCPRMDDVAKLGEILDKKNRQKYSTSALDRIIYARAREESIVSDIEAQILEKNIQSPRIIVYCKRIEHAERIAKLIKGAVVWHSDDTKLPKQQAQENFQAFKNGKARAIVAVDKINEGVDVPDANVLVFLRQSVAYNVLEQQLGRGLRLCEGKDFALVLDYVANCNRLFQYEQMRKEIEATQIHPDEMPEPAGGDGDGGEKPFDIEVDKSVFNGEWYDFIERLEEVSSLSYTKDEAIKLIQEWSQANGGKTPTELDIVNCKFLPGVSNLQNMFGSVNNAMIASGLTPNVIFLDDDELLGKLKWFFIEFGRVPTCQDLTDHDDMPDPSTYADRFETYNNALALAELTVNRHSNKSMSDDKALKLLRALYLRIGRTPTSEEIDDDPDCPSSQLYAKRFGTLSDTFRLIGAKPCRASDDELLAQLVVKIKAKNGKPPTCKEVNDDPNMAKSDTFVNRFGDLETAIALAVASDDSVKLCTNIKTRKKPQRNLTDEEVLQQIRDKKTRDGKTPTRRSIDADRTMVSATLIKKRFESVSNGIKIALSSNEACEKEEKK